MIEGRNYPEDRGPAAGCSPEHGLSTASTKHLRTRTDISQDARAKIGGLNAQRFYGLD